MPWEEGFFKGMVASRAFVPIFSREAINHPDKAHHNWASMHPQVGTPLSSLSFLSSLLPGAPLSPAPPRVCRLVHCDTQSFCDRFFSITRSPCSLPLCYNVSDPFYCPPTQSPAADPFFLEQRLALELRHLRLMSHIVPILVGDFKKSGTGTYANYWAKKCHPPEV